MARFAHLTELPDRPFRFIAVDVETASGPIESICQIGLCAVDADNGLHTLSVLVDPETPFAPFNTELHGIDAAMVAGAPRFPEAYLPLFDVLNAQPLVQHSRFDQRAFAAACARYDVPMLSAHWTDSVQVARKAWPELKGNGGHGLANLKKHLGLRFHHHDAGEDARAAASVILQAERHAAQQLPHLQAVRQLSFDFGAAPRARDNNRDNRERAVQRPV